MSGKLDFPPNLYHSRKYGFDGHTNAEICMKANVVKESDRLLRVDSEMLEFSAAITSVKS
jgi:hypothetical protein